MKLKNIIQKLSEILSKKQKKMTGGLFIIFLFSSLFQVVGVATIFPFINLVLDPSVIQSNELLSKFYNLMNFTSNQSFIVFVGIVMFALIVFSNILSAFTIWVRTKFVMNLNHNLARKLLSIYLSRPYDYFLNKNTSEMGKNILSEINQLTSKMLTPLFDFIINALVVLAIVIFLMFTDLKTTAIAFSILGGSYVIINTFVKKKVGKAGIKRVEANNGRFTITGEALSGIKTTKVLGREEYFLSLFTKYSKRYTRVEARVKVVSELPKYFLESIAFGGIILLVIILTITNKNASDIIPLVSLFAFAGYRMMPAMQKMYQSVSNIYFSEAILDTIHAEITGNNQIIEFEKYGNTKPMSFNNRIHLKHIDYIYPKSDVPVLKDIELKIQYNSSIGIVGHTGSGKTTLIDIIMGLLLPLKGQILVDNQALTYDNIRNWQKNIGYVPQEIFLTDDTIEKNIAFGLHDNLIDSEKVKTAAKIAALDDFIMNELPHQYQSKVGERGIRLSGGQRQRIGLARALYSNPKILVLDEATSSLDGNTETAVIEAIKNASKNRTMIMIAHRLSTVKDCDVIYLIEKGRIVDSGNYSSLLEHNSQFRRMAKL